LFDSQVFLRSGSVLFSSVHWASNKLGERFEYTIFLYGLASSAKETAKETKFRTKVA